MIDASVVLKWFLNEEDSNKAIKIREETYLGNISLIVPELIFSEVLNVLKYKKFNEKELSEINFALWNTCLIIQKTNKNLLDLAIKISIDNDFTIYDSIYIALAQLHGCELITADEELKKVPNVKILKE